ncbi:hypothetical protein M885DRAFT_505622 [Pelagophyceae sp. CCMP2097]|nr:hypothetical protein M885DRAFT_505622 [Pelagophyceae sp. CCMP2097]|mmetsp:Transcript_28666/g.98643  ORF Transcript_28666/g.98643 Transcript_28666/m.98643 type:complete len:245 (-) Transcript_28666:43-777(-)
MSQSALLLCFGLALVGGLAPAQPRVAPPAGAGRAAGAPRAAPLYASSLRSPAAVAAARQPAYEEYALPQLSRAERDLLVSTGRVERVSRRGRVGDAFVVVDTSLSVDEAWRRISDVADYPSLMRGIRTSTVRRNTASNGASDVRAGMKLTRLRLPANIVFTPVAEADADAARTLRFALDAQCTNLAVEYITGLWHVEAAAEDPSKTRIWLKASVGACALVPMYALDYVAAKALKRATEWLPSRR